MTSLLVSALAVALSVVGGAAQAPALTTSGTEPLVSAGWMQEVDGELYVNGPAVAQVAATLDVYSKPVPGYDRVGYFGQAWATKVDGCDTRNRILKRDMVSSNTDWSSKGDSCTVTRGVLDDPYTGTVIQFQHSNYPTKKAGNSSTIQIDHIVPLKAAWNGGANTWTQDKRVQFANDPVNLWAAQGSANGAKRGDLFGAWKPANSAFWCEYVAKQVWVLDQYDIAVLQSDKDAFVAEAQTCLLPGAASNPQQSTTPAPTESTTSATPAHSESPAAAAHADHSRQDMVNIGLMILGGISVVVIAWALASFYVKNSAARRAGKNRTSD